MSAISRRQKILAGHGKAKAQYIQTRRVNSLPSSQKKMAIDPNLMIKPAYNGGGQQQHDYWGEKDDYNIKIKNNDLNIDNNAGYKPGQFSKFAFEQEQKQIQTMNFVNKIISQALESHLESLKQFIQTQQKLDAKARAIQTQYRTMFATKQMMVQFLKSPIEASLMEIALSGGYANNQSVSGVQQVINLFAKRLIYLRNYAYVENRIINLRDFNFNEYMKDNLNNFYVRSIYHENTMIKIDQSSVPSLVFFSNNQILNRRDLMEINRSEREIIIDMIYRFLVKKNIMISKDEIMNIVAQKLSNLIPKTS